MYWSSLSFLPLQCGPRGRSYAGFRIELLPHVSAEAEAALWFSPLVQAHSADGITLSVPVAVALRKRLVRQWQTKRRSLLEQARAIYAEVHAYLPPPLRLEEEIAWCLVAGDEDGINERVDSAVAAVIADSEQFRFWAAQASARLPDGIRVAQNGTLLAQAGTAYRSLETKPLVVRHTGAEIEFACPIGPGSRRIDVPDATAVPLALRWPSAQGPATEDVVVDPRDGAVPVRVQVSGHVEVRTAAGVTYVVRDDPFERPSRIDPVADPHGELQSMLTSRRVSGLRLAEGDEPAEIGVELRSGRVTLVDAAGQALPAVPQLDPRGDGLAARTAALAAHVSRWLTVAELRSGSPVLAGTVEVAVAGAGTGPGQDIDVAPTDSVIATITNLGSEPLFVAILALSSDWSVEVLTGGKASSALNPGARWEGRLRLDGIALGHDRGFVRVLGVAARQPFDPRPLILPAISQAGQDRPPVAAQITPGLDTSSLDTEFAVMTGAPAAGLHQRYLEWITGEAVVHVRSRLGVARFAGIVAPPMLPVRYVVMARREETADTVTLMLRAVGNPIEIPRPGQFTMLYAYGVGEIPVFVSGFSGSGDPHLLVHTIRAVGAVSRALYAAAPGDMVGVRGPFGTDWQLHGADGRDILLVADGIGLAPLRPALLTALAERARYDRVVLLVGARSPGDLIFTRELETWRRRGADVRVTVDHGDAGWAGNVGGVTSLIESAVNDPASTMAFLSGPEDTMRLSAGALINCGVPATDIRISLERNMPCGTAVCGHCQLGPLLLCRDGPVVSYAEAAPLLAINEM